MSVELEERLDHLYSNLTPGRFEYMDADGAAFTVEEAADTLRRYRERIAELEAKLKPGWDVDGICNDHGVFACQKCAVSQVPHE